MPVRPETSKRQNRFKIERNMLEEEVVKKFYGENELRRMYLEFFESKGHLKMNSFSSLNSLSEDTIQPLRFSAPSLRKRIGINGLVGAPMRTL